MSAELENTNKQEQIFYQMTVDLNDTTIHSGILKFSEREIFGALRMSRAASKFRALSYSILRVSNFIQQVATTHNMVCKRSQHVGPNNVASCWPTMLRAFAPAFTIYPSSGNPTSAVFSIETKKEG